jgi:hypothetical protein
LAQEEATKEEMMADQSKEMLEMVIGAMMAQSALLEFLVKQKVIEHAPLLEHLAARRVVWEKVATPNALFSIDLLLSILAGSPPPRPPGRLN